MTMSSWKALIHKRFVSVFSILHMFVVWVYTKTLLLVYIFRVPMRRRLFGFGFLHALNLFSGPLFN